MKQLVLKIISGYQVFISPLLKQLLGVKSLCRLNPTCSEFAKQSIQKHGIVSGSRLFLRRFLSCQSFVHLYERN